MTFTWENNNMKDNLDKIQMANKYMQIHGKYLHLLVIGKKRRNKHFIQQLSKKRKKENEKKEMLVMGKRHFY